MYITGEELQRFAGKICDDDSLISSYCESACDIVAEFLGYNPEAAEYETTREGAGAGVFRLEALPVTEIKAAKINGDEVDAGQFVAKNKKSPYIVFADGLKFESGSLYSFVYRAGYENKTITDENGEESQISTVPTAIKTTALQIASLLWESSGGNLAVSSTSFAEFGSRVYNNFTPDRFLKNIDKYRIEKVDY